MSELRMRVLVEVGWRAGDVRTSTERSLTTVLASGQYWNEMRNLEGST